MLTGQTTTATTVENNIIGYINNAANSYYCARAECPRRRPGGRRDGRVRGGRPVQLDPHGGRRSRQLPVGRDQLPGRRRDRVLHPGQRRDVRPGDPGPGVNDSDAPVNVTFDVTGYFAYTYS
jgi:hypothetical protein